MGLFCSTSRYLFVIFFLSSTKVRPFSSSTSISDQVLQLESRGSAARHLLQAKKNCPVNLEFLDYKTLTNSCKGPNYPSDTCCPALKDLACPYSEYLNDLTNDCASTLFSYINLHGKYPPGLFSSECKEGKEGLACPASSPVASMNSSSSGSLTLTTASNPFNMLAMLSASSLVLRLHHEVF